MDQLPRLGKRELICLLLFTCNYVVSVWRGLLFLWLLGMGYVSLLWHSLSLPYIYLVVFECCAYIVSDLHSINNSVIRCFLKIPITLYVTCFNNGIIIVQIRIKTSNDSKYEMCFKTSFLSLKGKYSLKLCCNLKLSFSTCNGLPFVMSREKDLHIGT